jgi:DNA primase
MWLVSLEVGVFGGFFFIAKISYYFSYMSIKNQEYTPVIEILEDIFGEYKSHNDYKCQISFDCPVCSHEIKGLDNGDGKGNLEINYKDEVYKCWSCSESHDTHGSLLKLIRKYGNVKQLKKFKLLRPENDGEVEERKYAKVKLPNEFISFQSVSPGLKLTHHYKQALSYIRKRNITDEMIKKYNIGFCYDGQYQNRIIIPSYDGRKKLNYFIARSYLSKTKRKYHNPEAQKEIIIWNEHLIKWDQPVYIVEGVFDSIFLENSIPMLGKHISERLFKLLYENAKKIIIVLDGDAWNDTEKLYHKLNCGKLFGKVFVMKLPEDKDVADIEGKIEEDKIFQID